MTTCTWRLLFTLAACFITAALASDICINRHNTVGDLFENPGDASFCELFGTQCSSMSTLSCHCNPGDGEGEEDQSRPAEPCRSCTCPDSLPYFNEVLGRCEQLEYSQFGFAFRDDLSKPEPDQIDRRQQRLFIDRTFVQPATVAGWTVRLCNTRQSVWFLLQAWERRFGYYRIIGSTNITVSSSNGSGFTDVEFQLPPAEQFVVSVGDFFGIYVPPEFNLPFAHEVETPNSMYGALVYTRSTPVSILPDFTIEDRLEGLGFNFAAITIPPPVNECIPVPTLLSTSATSQSSSPSFASTSTPTLTIASSSVHPNPITPTTTKEAFTKTSTYYVEDPVPTSTIPVAETVILNSQGQTIPTTIVAGAVSGGAVLLFAVILLTVVISVCVARKKRGSKNLQKETSEHATPGQKDRINQHREYHFYEVIPHTEPHNVQTLQHTYATLERPLDVSDVAISNRLSSGISEIPAHYEVDAVFMSQRKAPPFPLPNNYDSVGDEDRANSITDTNIPSHYEIDQEHSGHMYETTSAVYEPQISPKEHIYEEAGLSGLKEPVAYEEFAKVIITKA